MGAAAGRRSSIRAGVLFVGRTIPSAVSAANHVERAVAFILVFMSDYVRCLSLDLSSTCGISGPQCDAFTRANHDVTVVLNGQHRSRMAGRVCDEHRRTIGVVDHEIPIRLHDG